MENELRFTPHVVEYRASGKGHAIGGYAAVFNRASSDLGGFVEFVDPGAFNRSKAADFPGVIARYNHDDNYVLGTTGAGTLRLKIDANGLDYEVDPPAARADVLELVQRGDVRQSSFAFRTLADDWRDDNGQVTRRLLDVELVDVAPVNTPAYPDATSGLRSLASKFDAPVEEVRSLAARGELRKFFRRTDGPTVPALRSNTRAQITELLAKRQSPYTRKV